MSDPLATIPLSAIRVFEAAARVKSFTRAADELGVTQAAVSWQVKALERRLGQPLFRRLPREVVLTEAGERLARAAAEAMKLLRTAVSDLTDQADGVLAVTAPQSLATKWLAPRIGGFQLEHPRIAVRLDTSNHLVDLDREGFDLAIRSGSGAWTGLESVYLFSTGRTPLCTPRVLAELGGLARPEALLTAPLIGLDEDWAEWFTAAGVTTPLAKRRGRLVADQQQIEVASAMAGQGVALGSPILFAAEIDQGALVRPFETMADESDGFWLAWTEGRRRLPRIAAFRDWLAASIARDQAKGLRESSPGAG